MDAPSSDANQNNALLRQERDTILRKKRKEERGTKENSDD